ncbi:MAG: hypothetical protein IID45_01260 [Planctomycetes bacterium]|nr:hypothetical protein [Planctomycetota bacterium]
MSEIVQTDDGRNSGGPRGFFVAVALAWLSVFWMEWDRLREAADLDGGVWIWLSQMQLDSSPYLIWLLLLPLFWLPRTPLLSPGRTFSLALRRWFGRETKPGEISAAGSVRRSFVLAAIIGAASFAASFHVSQKRVGPADSVQDFGDLPPAYHDEFSYLLQAKTFLTGRLSFPSHKTMPQLFDQLHVVNEGRYASRYFPATGAWLAPFVAAGHPYWGQWMAGALAAMFIFAAGRELAGNGVGFAAGMLTAISPGMAIFSNLLLSHHTAMLGLSIFLFAMLRMLRTRHWLPALVAGCALTFAMLARPMTAAGFALPFGVCFVVWLFRAGRPSTGSEWRFRITRLAAMGTPMLAGFVVLMIFNKNITGNTLQTPYSLFTDTYTPRHAYGFHNVTRAEERIRQGKALSNTTFEKYDRWAENLTPRLAVRNVCKRLPASWKWTLGIVPLLMATCVLIALRFKDDGRWRLIAAAIVSLHLFHVPYWYAGIQNWHYVFESGPLWLLLFVLATQRLFETWSIGRRPWMALWWCGLVAISLTTAYAPSNPFWTISRVDAEVEKIAFSRLKYHHLRDIIQDRVTDAKALILIEHNPDVIHIDYVSNEPDLTGGQRFLFGRFRPGQTDLVAVMRAFPDRSCYLYRVKQNTFERISPPQRE